MSWGQNMWGNFNIFIASYQRVGELDQNSNPIRTWISPLVVLLEYLYFRCIDFEEKCELQEQSGEGKYPNPKVMFPRNGDMHHLRSRESHMRKPLTLPKVVWKYILGWANLKRCNQDPITWTLSRTWRSLISRFIQRRKRCRRMFNL